MKMFHVWWSLLVPNACPFRTVNSRPSGLTAFTAASINPKINKSIVYELRGPSFRQGNITIVGL